MCCTVPAAFDSLAYSWLGQLLCMLLSLPVHSTGASLIQESSRHLCRCWLCQKGGGRQFRDLGPLQHLAINDKGTEMKWMHRQCLLWSPEVSEGRGSDLINVPKAVFRGRKINCKVGARSSCRDGSLLACLLSSMFPDLFQVMPAQRHCSSRMWDPIVPSAQCKNSQCG